jgi:aldehyde:ferredoxin oxidoreductase
MYRILQVNLTEGTTYYTPHEIHSLNDCGRALALKLLKEKVPLKADYFAVENAIVITPGLLSGTHAPSTGRFTIAAKQTKGGIRSVNLAGPFANRMASLGIAALFIYGSSDTNVVLRIDESGTMLVETPELKHAQVSHVIGQIRSQYGPEAAIVGIGPAGEHIMALSSIFSTYPAGEPQYFCVRGGMGDILGIKGLKAIVVSSEKEFSSELADRDAFSSASKALTSLMRQHPICGKALPSYGSITLMRMLKEGSSFDEKETDDIMPVTTPSVTTFPTPKHKINRACSVNCPIGCLNRHETSGASPFNSPFDSEAFAASKNLFGIEDQDFVIDLNKKCFELGLDSIEFLFSCAMILKVYKEGDVKSDLLRLFGELKEATPLGRIIGSTSRGIYNLYAENKDLKPMVTMAATSEQSKFIIRMPNRIGGLEALSDLEYLYSYILAAQNIGMCLFTTFAVLDDPQGLKLLAEMVSAQTGKTIDAANILQSGYDSLLKEREYEMDAMKAGTIANIPEFVKVLYRYFGREKNG